MISGKLSVVRKPRLLLTATQHSDHAVVAVLTGTSLGRTTMVTHLLYPQVCGAILTHLKQIVLQSSAQHCF